MIFKTLVQFPTLFVMYLFDLNLQPFRPTGSSYFHTGSSDVTDGPGDNICVKFKCPVCLIRARFSHHNL